MQLTRIGPFALEEPLDGLADGNVLRGVHVERQTSMAIKLLPRSVVDQPMGNTFAKDVKQLQQLLHPGIVRCYGGAVEKGQPYLALELVAGESLRERLDRRGKLPWEMTVEIADGICEALQYAHSEGVVHQRLTPARVLLGEHGKVKITGFDSVWADRDEVLGLRSPMSVAHYLAPEEFRGKRSASLPTCDLFSLGVILFECLSGELPWSADTPAELVRARRESSAPRVATKVLDCPVWLDVLVSRLLAVQRTERLASAEETHRAIANAKRKVASGMGTAQHAWSGQRGALAVDQDRSELRRLKRAARRKQRDDSPFYERAWFLAACLVGLIGVGVWSMLPPSEEALFAKAKPLMESDDPALWQRADQQYLRPLRSRFPDTQYAAEIQDLEDRLVMYQAERRIENNERLSRAPQSEAERRYAEAWRYERFGDRLAAWRKYDALIQLFSDSEDPYDRAFVKLARRQVRKIKDDQGAVEDQAAFLQQHLDRAEALVEAGKLLEARRILDSVVSLYDGNQELQPLVDRARARMRQLDRGGEASEN